LGHFVNRSILVDSCLELLFRGWYGGSWRVLEQRHTGKEPVLPQVFYLGEFKIYRVWMMHMREEWHRERR
jgi:hypothetical protein